MIAVPIAAAVTTPDDTPTGATDGILLSQVPPVTALASVDEVQISVFPVMAESGLTIAVTLATHPIGVV